MNLRIIVFLILLALMVSSCGTPATATSISYDDVQNTSIAAAFTVIAVTHEAKPTNTPVPPTEKATQTSIPSATPEPSPTSELSITPTLTPQATALGVDPCNKVLTSWQVPTNKLIVRYEYRPQGRNDKVVLSLWVMTDQKECGFLSSLSSGPVGQYSALAYVDGEKDFRVSGGFRLNEGSWEIIIRNDTIVAKGGCYPNC